MYSGGINIYVYGSNFGSYNASEIATQVSLVLQSMKDPNKIIILSPKLLNSTTIMFSLPIGQGDFNFKFVAGFDVNKNLDYSQTVSFSDVTKFSYDVPLFKSIFPSHGITAGGYNVLVTGESFGIPSVNGEFTASVFIGDTKSTLLKQNHKGRTL